MSTPLPVLRRHADEALEKFAASSGLDPEEVWETMAASTDQGTEIEGLNETVAGRYLQAAFRNLREAEVASLQSLCS